MKENKRVIIIILIIIILILGICCGYLISKKSNNKKTATVGSNQAENGKTNEEKYKAVIEEYKTAIRDTTIEDMWNIEEKYPYINDTMVMEKIRANENNSDYNFSIECTYYDIDKNGTDELIMFANYNGNNGEIIDIFLYDTKNNKPLKIVNDSSLGYRAHAIIYNNGIVYVQGSSGADNGIIEYSKIPANGYEIETSKYYYKYEDEKTLTFYNNYNDMENKKNKLSYTSFEEIDNLYVKNASPVNIDNLKPMVLINK